jgi:cytochrome P450
LFALSAASLTSLAGMDTTAHTLSFAVYALARHPEIQSRCQKEVDQWIASHASSESLSSLPPYVEAVLKEVMRKWPVAGPGSFRQVRQPEGVQLSPTLHVPQDWWVVVNIHTIHNSRAAWGDDVDEFVPERWLASDAVGGGKIELEEDPLSASMDTPSSSSKAGTSNNSHLSSPSCYAGSGYTTEELCFLPFSYGLRNCVGMNLALMELRITLLNLISRFHFSLGDEEMRDESKLFETVFTLRPRQGCPIRVSKRG